MFFDLQNIEIRSQLNRINPVIMEPMHVSESCFKWENVIIPEKKIQYNHSILHTLIKHKNMLKTDRF